jgi:hypothetical protein
LVTLPSSETWVQFPVVAVIVLCIALIAAAVFAFTKWVWGEYLKQRDLDLQWREGQNTKREASVAEQNKLWRDAMALRDARYEQYDKERQELLAQISASMAGVAHQLQEHDDQAKRIMEVTERIDQNTQPIPGAPGYKRKKVTGE